MSRKTTDKIIAVFAIIGMVTCLIVALVAAYYFVVWCASTPDYHPNWR